MTKILSALVGAVSLAVLASCGPSGISAPADGPQVTRVLVQKSQRKMFLLSGNQVVKQYDIGLGFEPNGPKMFEGDGRTPEGTYFIDRHNPRSQYHLSLGISYPSPADRMKAAGYGIPPGSDIMIHGQGPAGQKLSKQARDWTAGCIAVKDSEIEEVFRLVGNGVPVTIRP